MDYQSPIEGCEEAFRQLKKNVIEATELFNNIVTVVRCKDCKWWHESETNKGYGDCGQANGITLKSSDWFCADGERKEGR